MYRSTNDFKVIAIILLDGLEYKIKKLYSDIGNWAYALTVASGELHNAIYCIIYNEKRELISSLYFKSRLPLHLLRSHSSQLHLHHQLDLEKLNLNLLQYHLVHLFLHLHLQYIDLYYHDR